MIAMFHPFATPATEDRSAAALAESFWLKEAKAALRARDPVDAACDAEALARWADSFSGQLALPTSGASHARQAQWADLHCGGILQTSTATTPTSFFFSNFPAVSSAGTSPC